MTDSALDRVVMMLARRVQKLETDAEDTASSSQMAFRSVELEDGPIEFYNSDNLLVGQLSDTGYTAIDVVAPLVPTAPDTVAVPGGVSVIWDGTFVDGTWEDDGVQLVEIHAVSTLVGLVLDDTTQIGSFVSSNGGVYNYTIAASAGARYYLLQTMTVAGEEGAPSAASPATTAIAVATSQYVDDSIQVIEDDIAAVNSIAGSGGSTLASAITTIINDFATDLDALPDYIQSASLPGTTANVAGTIWERVADLATTPRKVISRWIGLGGTSWRQVALDATFIPQIDIGTGTFGSLSGGRLVANSVGTSQLVVTDLNNYIQDPDFKLGLWTAISGQEAIVNTLGPDGVSNVNAYRVAGSASAVVEVPAAAYMPVIPGETYNLLMAYKHDGGAPSTAQLRGQMVMRDAAGNISVPSGATITLGSLAAGTWATYSADFTVPAGIVEAYWRPWIGATLTSGNIYITRMRARRKFGGELVVDGWIKTQHLFSDFVSTLLTTSKVLQTNTDPQLGLKMSDAGFLAYDSQVGSTTYKTAKFVVNPVTGVVGAIDGQFVGGQFVTGDPGENRMRMTDGVIPGWTASQGFLEFINSSNVVTNHVIGAAGALALIHYDTMVPGRKSQFFLDNDQSFIDVDGEFQVGGDFFTDLKVQGKSTFIDDILPASMVMRGRRIVLLDAGSASDVSSAAGLCTLTHNLNITGAYQVLLTSRANGGTRIFTIEEKNADNFKFRVNNDAGAIVTGVNIGFDYWIVG